MSVREHIDRVKKDKKLLFVLVGFIAALIFLPYLAIPALLLWWFYKKSKFSKRFKTVSTSIVCVSIAVLMTFGFIAYAKDEQPQLTVAEPQERTTIKAQEIIIKGSYTPSDRKVWLNGKEVSASNGGFETTYSLKEGENKIEVSAGNWKRARTTLYVVRELTDEEIAARATPSPSNASPESAISAAETVNSNLEYVKVTKVVDGDTIQIEGGKTVRYIGIDTPETVDPRTTVQCYGKEASNRNKQIVEGATIGLEKDVSETDKYGRLLRYVYKDDAMVNLTLVQEGYAYSSSYPPDIKHQDKFRTAEQQAKSGQKGLWGSCNANTNTTQPTTNTASPKPATSQPTTTAPSNSSGDKDCKDFKTHSEAQAYFNSKGGSSSNNVDNLDADHDGLACETLP